MVQLWRKKFRNFLLFAMGASIPFALMIGYVFVLPDVVEYMQRTEFDSEVWRGAHTYSSHEPVRLRMVDDLLDEYDLYGMRPSELERLLGPGDRTKMWDASYVYWLGPERGWLSIDSEWLLIELDSKSRVSEVLVVRD